MRSLERKIPVQPVSAMQLSSSLIWRVRLLIRNVPTAPAKMSVENSFSFNAPGRRSSNWMKTPPRLSLFFQVRCSSQPISLGYEKSFKKFSFP